MKIETAAEPTGDECLPGESKMKQDSLVPWWPLAGCKDQDEMLKLKPCTATDSRLCALGS